jgi:hypothetical protein
MRAVPGSVTCRPSLSAGVAWGTPVLFIYFFYLFFQVGSGVAIDLGLANCINTLEFVASDGASGASGGLQVPKKKMGYGDCVLKSVNYGLICSSKINCALTF